MEKFRGVDYYGIDDLLTEEQRMMRDAVRDWVESRFVPIVAQHHRDGTFPAELYPKVLRALEREGRKRGISYRAPDELFRFERAG